MPIGCFLEKLSIPTAEEIRATLGMAYPLWQRLIGFNETSYQLPPPALSFGGKNYGWNLWYRAGGKTLISIYPQQGYLVAQVVLGREQVEKALALSLGEKVGRMLRETPQLHDGKWLFIPVNTAEDAAGVEQLLLVKRKPTRKKE